MNKFIILNKSLSTRNVAIAITIVALLEVRLRNTKCNCSGTPEKVRNLNTS